MRDLINLIDQITLTEGRGLSARNPGEKFADGQGNVIVFQGLEFYPPRGRFNDLEEMNAAIQQLGYNIHWTNKSTTAMLGFGIAAFKISDGKTYYLGRYFKEISPNRVSNVFPHDAIPGGFKLDTGLGQKESAGLKPSEILTKFKSNTPESIAEQVRAKFGDNSDEANAMAVFLSTSNFPVRVPKGSMNVNAFRDYFCEMLQPIALVKGMPVKGNAQEAAEIFFGSGRDYSDCIISFNEGVSGGLYDSLLVNSEGKQIKLSSKGKSGANASVVNLLRCITELQVAPKGKLLLAKHTTAVDILKTIDDSGHFGAPIELAASYGIIDKDDGQKVMSLRNLGPEDKIDWGKHKKLEQLYNGRSAKDKSRIIPIEHMIAAIAYKVADHVNETTNFSQAASDILNHSALVQMYTEANESGEYIIISGFTAVYPSETVTGVLLDASKAYMSTQGKGNFTFHILKHGEKPPKKSDMVDAEPELVATPGVLTGKRTEIRPTRARKDSGTADIGRERR